LFGDGGAEIVAEYAGLVEGVVRPPFHEGGLWLVRPDGYVVVATRAGDWGMVTEVLEKVKGLIPA
jgi:hypothetical protein